MIAVKICAGLALVVWSALVARVVYAITVHGGWTDPDTGEFMPTMFTMLMLALFVLTIIGLWGAVLA